MNDTHLPTHDLGMRRSIARVTLASSHAGAHCAPSRVGPTRLFRLRPRCLPLLSHALLFVALTLITVDVQTSVDFSLALGASAGRCCANFLPLPRLELCTVHQLRNSRS